MGQVHLLNGPILIAGHISFSFRGYVRSLRQVNDGGASFSTHNSEMEEIALKKTLSRLYLTIFIPLFNFIIRKRKV
jgi:hypothetical protein